MHQYRSEEYTYEYEDQPQLPPLHYPQYPVQSPDMVPYMAYYQDQDFKRERHDSYEAPRPDPLVIPPFHHPSPASSHSMPFASPRPPYVFVSESSPYPPLLTPPSPHQNLATPGTPDYKLAVSLFNQNHTESYEPPAHYDYDYPKYNATVPEPSSQTKFRCDCGKEFESLKKLESHSRTHREKPDKPHVCEQCQRGFTRRQDLKRHSEIHFRLFKPFACAKCSTTFTRSDALQRHLKARRCQ